MWRQWRKQKPCSDWRTTQPVVWCRSLLSCLPLPWRGREHLLMGTVTQSRHTRHHQCCQIQMQHTRGGTACHVIVTIHITRFTVLYWLNYNVKSHWCIGASACDHSSFFFTNVNAVSSCGVLVRKKEGSERVSVIVFTATRPNAVWRTLRSVRRNKALFKKHFRVCQ